MDIHILLFDGFESLDVFGPAEVFGHLENCRIFYSSRTGGTVTGAQGMQILTTPLSELDPRAALLIPGGMGTRLLARNEDFLRFLKTAAEQAAFCLSVCTGSVLLARTGLLDGRKATSNKRALRWAAESGRRVNWQQRARWTIDGKFYTSSGVSAGIDMCLAFVAKQFGASRSVHIASAMEYLCDTDPSHDPFSPQPIGAE